MRWRLAVSRPGTARLAQPGGLPRPTHTAALDDADILQPVGARGLRLAVYGGCNRRIIQQLRRELIPLADPLSCGFPVDGQLVGQTFGVLA